MNALESSAFPGDYVAMQTLAELEKDVAWKRIAKEKKKKNGRRFSLAHFCNNVIVRVISTWGINKPPN